MIFYYFKHYFIFLTVNQHLTVPFVELARGGCCVSHLHFFCLLAWSFPHLRKLNFTYCLKFSLLLAFCFLFVCMIDQLKCTLIHLIIRIVSGDYMQYWEAERGKPGALNYWGDLHWRGNLVWKEDVRAASYHGNCKYLLICNKICLQ